MRRDIEDPTLNKKSGTEQEQAHGDTESGGENDVINIKEHASVAEPQEFFATVKGEKFKFRELSLSEKMHVLSLLPDSFEKFLKNFRIEQKSDSTLGLAVLSDGVTLGDLPVSSLITSSAEALLYILPRSFPDCKEDWNSLPESETRDAILYALILNGWGAFIQNFFPTLKMVHTPFMKRPS